MKNTLNNKNLNCPFWTYYLVFFAFFIPLFWVYNVHAAGVTVEQTKIIESFIHFEEGKSLKGYVPRIKGSSSGVTIGYGVDLGQMHLKEFHQLAISEPLKRKLTPYIGLKQEMAIAYLYKHPLEISHAEMLELSWVAKNKILQPLVQSYDKHSKTRFLALPPEAQTVIFSFAYQHGPNFKKKYQHYLLWHYFTSQNWSEASLLLKSHTVYTNRRYREAALLDRLTSYKN